MAESLPFDRVADCYDESRGGERRGDFVADLLAPHLPAGGRLVELGVGTGIMGLAMRARGFDVVGVDLSPAMLAKAHQRMGPRVAIGDAQRAPLRTASADGAYLVWVLHVVADPQAVLHELVRVVAPGGAVAVVPANIGRPDPDEPMDLLHAPLDGLRGHDHRPDPEAVAGWMTQAGIVGVELRTSFDEAWRSPDDAADALESRSWSSLWHIDDDTWDTVVAPVIASLRALPDPHVKRRQRVPVDVLTGSIPT